jgi:hypothetical protein
LTLLEGGKAERASWLRASSPLARACSRAQTTLDLSHASVLLGFLAEHRASTSGVRKPGAVPVPSSRSGAGLGSGLIVILG